MGRKNVRKNLGKNRETVSLTHSSRDVSQLFCEKITGKKISEKSKTKNGGGLSHQTFFFFFVNLRQKTEEACRIKLFSPFFFPFLISFFILLPFYSPKKNSVLTKSKHKKNKKVKNRCQEAGLRDFCPESFMVFWQGFWSAENEKLFLKKVLTCVVINDLVPSFFVR